LCGKILLIEAFFFFSWPPREGSSSGKMNWSEGSSKLFQQTNKQTNKKRQVWIVFHVEMIIWKKEKHKKAGVNRFPRWNLTVTYALSNGDGEAISYFFQWVVMFFRNWGIKKKRESDIICLLENNFISKSNFF